VKHKFKFTTGNIANSGSAGKIKASLGNDACAVEFTPAGKRLSTEIEMSCPLGTLSSPLKVEAFSGDGWFLETVEYSDGSGSSWNSFGPSNVWVDKPPYNTASGNYECSGASPCDVRTFTPFVHPQPKDSVEYKFKFITGTRKSSQSNAKIKASLGNDACAAEFRPAGQGLSTEIEMSCPVGTLSSPLKVEVSGKDGWFLERVEYSDGSGDSWDSFGPSNFWFDWRRGNDQCTSPCDVKVFSHKVPPTLAPTLNPTLKPIDTTLKPTLAPTLNPNLKPIDPTLKPVDPTLKPVDTTLKTINPTLKTINTADSCETNTELLMEKIHENYSDTRMTETKLSTNEIFVDFSTNSGLNKVYAAACAAEGSYQELHYTATCNTNGFEEKMIVSGHPRCYASTCAPKDQAMLLQKFAIQLMEERANENSNRVFTCEGKKSTVEYSSLCDYQTQTLNSADELTLQDLEPSVDSKKFLWIFDRTEQLVTFAEGAEASDYQTACTARDGNLSVKTIQALCTDKATEEVDVPYSIEGYTVCLASGCNADTADTSALVSFVSMMKIQTKFSSTMACEVSGAGLLTMGVVMALTFCSVLLQAC